MFKVVEWRRGGGDMVCLYYAMLSLMVEVRLEKE